MKTLPAEEARTNFSQTISQVAFGNEPVIVTRHGKDVAAIISLRDFELLNRLLDKVEDSIDLEACKKGLEEAEREGTISWNSIRAELDL